MSFSLLNVSLWGKIKTIFDLIPKAIYFLYACLASAIDALQALVRKLAGLDVYYQTVQGESQVVSNTDPLTEFVYGILGFGESAYLYEALNTVFWSLAIFGLIMLAVSIMIALIKSHYGEDVAQTGPWKYFYTAGKAIATFAIVPIAVIIGLQLSTFVLTTLDGITAGGATNASLQPMFGSEALARFQPGEEATVDEDGQVQYQTLTYSNYDMLGARAPTTSVTFSGMLFNAAAYSANRARNEVFTVTQMRSIMGGLFGADDSDYSQANTDAERLEYMAQQVDYLFQNAIQLRESYPYRTLVDEVDDVVAVWVMTDLFAPWNVQAFTKFNPSLVWVFYDLWQFNFIIAFIGVFTAFSIMISIILGLMTRLIKGAAYFLVYPALLGIAPLDNFKAFKSTIQNLTQQIMMAFGAIIGINLLLLLLPYVQTINFFNFGVVDAVIQLLMLITGLLMAKDFIGMVNGFVGGADVLGAGDSLKGQIGGKLKGAIKPAAAFGAAGVRAGVALGKGVGRKVAGQVRKHKLRSGSVVREANAAAREVADFEATKDDILSAHTDRLDEAQRKATAKALAQGLSQETAEEKGKEAREEMADEILHDKATYSSTAEYKKFIDAEKSADKARAKATKLQATYKLNAEEDTSDPTGRTVKFSATSKSEDAVNPKIKKEMWAEAGKALADGLLKSLKGFSSGFGLDKPLQGAGEILGETFTLKGGVFETLSKKKKEKEDKEAATAKEKEAAALQQKIAERTSKQADKLDQMVAELSNVARATASADTTQQTNMGELAQVLRDLKTATDTANTDQISNIAGLKASLDEANRLHKATKDAMDNLANSLKPQTANPSNSNQAGSSSQDNGGSEKS